MIVILLSVLSLCSITGAFEIRHIDSNNAHLIDTSPTNYAVNAPNLLQNGWKTVSVNGDNVAIIAPNCQSTMKSSHSLTDTERNLINGVRSVTTTNNNQFKYSSYRYSLDGSVTQAVSSGASSFQSNNGASISKSDDNNYSIARPGMPMNLARIFLNHDVATFVYLDGQVQMKPTNCLQPAEQQLLQQLRLEVKQAEEQFRASMHKFQQSMQMMGQNLNNNMQQMQQSLGNMFNGMGGYSNTNYNAYPTQNSINPVGQYQAQRPLANNMIPMPSTSAGAVYTLPTPAVNPFNPFSYNFMQMNPFGANFPLGPNNPFASFTGFTG